MGIDTSDDHTKINPDEYAINCEGFIVHISDTQSSAVCFCTCIVCGDDLKIEKNVASKDRFFHLNGAKQDCNELNTFNKCFRLALANELHPDYPR